MKGLLALGAVFLALSIAVLGYGYWFGRTHGSLSVYVDDVSDRQRTRPVVPVDLSFLDSSGNVMAKAGGAPPDGVIYITEPAVYACHEVELRAITSAEGRAQWSTCFAGQSRWLPTWIRRVTAVNLRTGACAIEGMPVSVSEYPDSWWLWWVPLPHVGGKPYTYFSILISLERQARCR